jgi:dihydrodipicolinate synthase/N-acetylneuraminate lyase
MEQLFPGGVPGLWCPTLTHFSSPGIPDEARIRKHLDQLVPSVGGLLVPGSTGEGWDLDQAAATSLVKFIATEADRLGLYLLIGILKKDTDSMCADIDRWGQVFRDLSPESRGGLQPPVVGFTVCPPAGADLDQGEIESGLRRVLDLGFPIALYQLPQVTGNRMGPELIARLADDFSTFILFKDTSGEDTVAASGLDLGGVFLVRGAELNYAKQLQGGGGFYNGLLLSTANAFPRDLREVFDLLADRQEVAAGKLSERLDRVIGPVFKAVEGIPAGNPFTNANKALDHWFAHGSSGAEVPPPMLFGGERLPREVLDRVRVLLEAEGFEIGSGYVRED